MKEYLKYFTLYTLRAMLSDLQQYVSLVADNDARALAKAVETEINRRTNQCVT